MGSFASADLQKLFNSSLQTLFVLNRVEDEASKQRMLLAVLGPELGALVEARCAPRAPAQLRYEELLALLGGGPASPEQLAARGRLYTARRTPGESLRAWAERLQTLAVPACLGAECRVVLRDLFLAGLGSTQLQQRLYHHGLDLDGDLETALQAALHLVDDDQVTGRLDNAPQVAPQLEDDDHSEINQQDYFDDDDKVAPPAEHCITATGHLYSASQIAPQLENHDHSGINIVTGHLDSAPQVAPQLEDDDHSEINQQDSDDEVAAAISAAGVTNKHVKVQDGAVAIVAVDSKVHISGNINVSKKAEIMERGHTAKKPLPYKLRNALSTFRGRDEYLRELTETLDGPDCSVVVVHGLSGVGKSELCNQYAWRHMEKYQENIVWVKYETAEHLEAELCALARELDVNTRSTEWVQPSDRPITQITKDVYSQLREKGACLLVLDDVLTRDQINKYLPGAQHKNIRVLITSPYAHWEGVRTIKLQSLTTDECKLILKAVVKNSIDFEKQKVEVDNFLKIIEGNPLAVQICSAYISYVCRPAKSNFELGTYVCKLENEKDIIVKSLPKSSEHNYNKTIYISFATTLEKIQEITENSKLWDVLEILNVCAYLNAEAVPQSLLRDMCRTEDLAGAIQVLDDFSLIYIDQNEHVRMHKLIQKSIIQHQEKSDVNSAWFRKVLTYFLACSEHYEVQLVSVIRHAQHYTQVVLDIFQNQSYTSKLSVLLVSYDCRTNVKHIFEHIKGLTKIRKVVRDSNLVHVAVHCNKRQMVRYLLHHEDDVDRLDKGLTPLMIAAARGLEDVAKLLISRRAQVNKTGLNRNTSLHLAAQHGHLDMCKLLLKNNCSDIIQNSDGYCPIHVAAEEGQLEVVELLVRENSASATWTTLYGDISLHLTARAGHVHILRYFLEELKIAVDTPGQRGRTALMLAAWCGHTEVVRCLLEHGASPQTYDPLMKRSVLRRACEGGHTDIVALLIAAGGEVNALDDYGWGPLHEAARKGHLDVVRALCDAGARCDVYDCFGHTPLSEASRQGHTAVYDFLRERFPGVKSRRM